MNRDRGAAKMPAARSAEAQRLACEGGTEMTDSAAAEDAPEFKWRKGAD
jgi:hypothetical protein